MPNKKKKLPSINIPGKQLLFAIIIIGLIILIPIAINYFSNPDRTPMSQTIEEVAQTLDIETEVSEENQLTVSIPLVNQSLNLGLLKQNPQLAIYVGLGLFGIAILTGITLIRSLKR